MANPKFFVMLRVLCFAGAASAADEGCEPSGRVEYVCGIKNAEDLVVVPGTKWIIASGMAEGAGLTLIDSRNGQRSALYPGERPQARHDTAFPDCTTPPAPNALNTHGLNVRAGERGRSTLYVVGHGGREAIEEFDIDASGDRPTANS